MNDYIGALKIQCLLKDVEKEIKHAREKSIHFNMVGYDIDAIVGEQYDMYCKYLDKIEELKIC